MSHSNSNTTTRFTCFSKAHGGCGALHYSRGKATACCKVHRTKHNEERTPVACSSKEELEAKYPAGQAAAERRAIYLATKGVDPGKGNDGQGQADSQSTDPASGQADGDSQQSSGEQSGDDDGASSSADQSGDGDGDSSSDEQSDGDGDSQQQGQHPLQPLAEELHPLMAEPMTQHIVPAVAELIQQQANDPADVAALRTELTAARSLLKKRLDETEQLQTKLAAELAKINEVKKVELTIKTPAATKPIKGAAHQMFPQLLQLVGAGENVFMSGPAGSGKTTAAQMVADSLDMDLIVQPVAMDKFEATGFVDAGGSYRESAVYRWAKAEKPSILLIDEIDGWLPQALVALNPILDNRMGIFPGGQQFTISDKHRVIATANTWGTGADAEYVGRNRLDAASLDRFGARLDWGYDERFEVELLIGQFGDVGQLVVTASQRVRKNLKTLGIKVLWGPRQTIGLARRVSAGMTLPDAFDVSALAQLTDSNQQRVLDGVLSSN